MLYLEHPPHAWPDTIAGAACASYRPIKANQLHDTRYHAAICLSERLIQYVLEFVDSLQQHVVRQRNGVPSGGLQHRLDNHSLWHNAYRRSNDACTRAQDENEHLKREVARLQNELNVANEPTARSSRKRKTNADTGSTTNSTPKRMKATPDALPSFSYDEDLVLLDGTPKGAH